jgi:hypothetical protein
MISIANHALCHLARLICGAVGRSVAQARYAFVISCNERRSRVATQTLRFLGAGFTVCAILVQPSIAQATSKELLYQVDFGAIQTSGANALASLPSRVDTIFRWNACGLELEFLSDYLTGSDSFTSEGTIQKLIAKLEWVKSHMTKFEPCLQSRWIDVPTLNIRQAWQDDWKNVPPAIVDRTWIEARVVAINNLFRATFGSKAQNGDPFCDYDPFSTGATSLPEGPIDSLIIKNEARVECMKHQINAAVMSMQVVGQLGTDKTPCHVVDVVHGDWDTSLKDVVRLYFLDKSFSRSGGVLTAASQTHIFNDLFSVDGPPGPETYSLWECGDTQKSSGSPQDRADDRAWYDAPFFSTLGDILKWLAVILIVYAVIAAAIYIAGAATAAAVGEVVVAAAVAVAVAGIAFARIPETENHLLLINTSRYLINQLIIDGLDDEDDKAAFQKDQREVKEWLIDRLRRIAKEDFVEYNAKPYQRYSITALLNLYDFAKDSFDPQKDDSDLKNAAHVILEYASAKFAASSAQGRRIAPYRRLMETVEDDWLGYGPAGPPSELFDISQGADYQIAQMLLFAGPNSNLPMVPPILGSQGIPLFSRHYFVSIPSAGDMMYAATSDYRPHALVVDAALNKTTFDQRFRHDGAEIYSATPSFMISAGGIRSKASGAVQLPGGAPVVPELSRCTDRGAGLPTVLLPAAGAPRTKLADFLRIEGPIYKYSHAGKVCTGGDFVTSRPNEDVGKEKKDRQYMWSHDHNLCVWQGFACGTNIVVPADMEVCLVSVSDLPSSWRFFDSSSCAGYQGSSKFYAVIYREPCMETSEKCVGNWGFFHAVDNPAMSFQDFQVNVVAENFLKIPYDTEKQTGNYSDGKETIEFSAAAHQKDDEDWGITSIGFAKQGDLDTWKLAEGAFITSAGDGLIIVHSLTGGKSLELDLADGHAPRYQEK